MLSSIKACDSDVMRLTHLCLITAYIGTLGAGYNPAVEELIRMLPLGVPGSCE